MKRLLFAVFVVSAVVTAATLTFTHKPAKVDPLEARAAAFMDAYNRQDGPKACAIVAAGYWDQWWGTVGPGFCTEVFNGSTEEEFTPLDYRIVAVLRVDGTSAVVIVETKSEYGKALLKIGFMLSRDQPSSSYRGGEKTPGGPRQFELKPGVSKRLPFARWQVVATGAV